MFYIIETIFINVSQFKTMVLLIAIDCINHLIWNYAKFFVRIAESFTCKIV